MPQGKYKLAQPFWRTIRQSEFVMPYHQAIPFLRMSSRKILTGVHREPFISMFFAASFVIKTDWKKYCPLTEWLN